MWARPQVPDGADAVPAITSHDRPGHTIYDTFSDEKRVI